MLSGRKHNVIHDTGLFISFMAIYVLVLTGCGYRATAGGEYIDKRIQTVFVDNFGNRTSEANVENTMRSAFIDQFIKGRRLKLVDKREEADALCRGSIESLTTVPLAYNKDNLAAEERITVTIEIILEEQGAGKVLWSDKSFSAIQDYQFSDIATKIRNRKIALGKLSNDSAEKAYRLMMSGF
jgi:hypothetical protein